MSIKDTSKSYAERLRFNSDIVTPSRKREKSQAQQQSDLEFVAIRESVAMDVSAAKENEAALKLEREEANAVTKLFQSCEI